MRSFPAIAPPVIQSEAKNPTRSGFLHGHGAMSQGRSASDSSFPRSDGLGLCSGITASLRVAVDVGDPT